MIAPRTALPDGCVLYASANCRLDGLQRALDEKHIAVLPAEPLVRGELQDVGPAVLCVDRSLADTVREQNRLPAHVTIVATDAAAETALGEAADLSFASIPDEAGRQRVLLAALQLSACRHDATAAHAELARSHADLAELNRIGTALMHEHDHDALLHQIVEQVMRLTCSDGGALFLVEKPPDEPPRLRFKIVLSHRSSSLPRLKDLTFPIDSSSLIGYVVLTKKPLAVDDTHHLPEGAEYRVNLLIQEQLNYRIKSMLTLPMIDHLGEVMGVLQLANRMRDPDARIECAADVEQNVVSYAERDVELGQSLAAQAAVSIENVQLYEQIENLFECFVKAAVTAIEQRDPATSGHSVRVATLVTDLATAVERSGRPAYRDLRFTHAQMRELHYAALLHDFGKVGVREDVLVKAKKLSPEMSARVEDRYYLIRRTLELEHERERAAVRASHRRQRKQLLELDAAFAYELAQLDRFWSTIRRANEPAELPIDVADELMEAARHSFAGRNGEPEPYLTVDELHYLQIPIGSLDESERLEVQSHAEQTFQFLSQIDWTDDLKHMARYAAAHHEKLDGSGYPDRLTASDIPVQTRLITVADIFDALTASDRPYKPAVSTESALDILTAEAKAGSLDRDIVHVLIDSQVYRHVTEEDWHRL